MEAGVGRGQNGGQRCTSCMLGNAALLFSPSSVSASACKCKDSRFVHAACTAHTYEHTLALPPNHLLLSRFIELGEIFSIFLISLSLSVPHTLIHSLIHLLLSQSLSFSLCLPPSPPLPPPTPSLHICLTFISKCREGPDRGICVEDMLSSSQVGNSVWVQR